MIKASAAKGAAINVAAEVIFCLTMLVGDLLSVRRLRLPPKAVVFKIVETSQSRASGCCRL